MNPKYFSKSAKIIALAAILSYGANLHAVTLSTAHSLSVSVTGQNEFQPMAFSDSAEAGMLRRAYHILATGDHDYKGHRAKAMKAVEAAGDLLGMNLHGDDKDRQPQAISDEKLLEVRGLLSKVVDSSEVKGQERIVKHINDAIKQLTIALSVK